MVDWQDGGARGREVALEDVLLARDKVACRAVLTNAFIIGSLPQPNGGKAGFCVPASCLSRNELQKHVKNSRWWRLLESLDW